MEYILLQEQYVKPVINIFKINKMKLPVNYNKLHPFQRTIEQQQIILYGKEKKFMGNPNR